MSKLCMIILNYNDWPTALSLADEVKGFGCLDSIVVVDNHSTDDSWEHLKRLEENEKFHLLRCPENGGYGSGNQAGIDYALSHLGADYVLVANPDIHVTEECILRVRSALDHTHRAAVASARVRSLEGGELFSYWTLLPLWKDLLDTGLVTRRLFRSILNVPPYGLAQGGDRDCRLVGAVPGSFFMVKLSMFSEPERKELFDKDIFLYYEEKVLGQKLAKKGLKTVLVTDQSYIHAHSVSVDKSIRRIGDKQQLLHESKLYYYKTYLGAGPVKLAAARAWLAFVLAEVRFLTQVCRMRW